MKGKEFFDKRITGSGRDTGRKAPVSLQHVKREGTRKGSIMNNGMSYEEFQKQLLERMRQHFQRGYQIKLHEVIKNNGLHLDSLVVLEEKSRVSPEFYLQTYYTRYRDGETVEELVQEIKDIYYRTRRDTENLSLDLSLDNCRDRIIYRLVSCERNQEMWEQVPYIPFLDMMIVFHCLIMREQDGIGSIGITNHLMEDWGLDTKHLYQIAQENTMRLFPKRICSLNQLFLEMIRGMEQVPEEVLSQIENSSFPGEPWVITNTSEINGASVILYPDCLKEIGEHLQEDFFVLPSSIHEMIVVSASEGQELENLEEMVREVNQSCVRPEDILSDHVYWYHCQNNTLEIVPSNQNY